MLGRVLIAFICSFALVACGEDYPGFTESEGEFLQEVGAPEDEWTSSVRIGYAICRIHDAAGDGEARELIHEESELEPHQIEAYENAALEHLC